MRQTAGEAFETFRFLFRPTPNGVRFPQRTLNPFVHSKQRWSNVFVRPRIVVILQVQLPCIITTSQFGSDRRAKQLRWYYSESFGRMSKLARERNSFDRGGGRRTEVVRCKSQYRGGGARFRDHTNGGGRNDHLIRHGRRPIRRQRRRPDRPTELNSCRITMAKGGAISVVQFVHRTVKSRRVER